MDKMFSFCIRADRWERLKAICDREGKVMSEEIRRAIDFYLEQNR